MKERGKILTMLFILVGIFFIGIIMAEKKACNKPGTLAHQINWAGHNCEKSKNKKVVKPVKIVKDKSQEKIKKQLVKWLKKGTEEVEEEVEEVEEVEEESEYSIQVEIDKCYENFDKLEHSWWSYINDFSKCKRKELIFQNCFYEEEGPEKDVCIIEARKESDALSKDSRREYFRNTPEEAADQEREELIKKNEKREELKDTIREALEESGE